MKKVVASVSQMVDFLENDIKTSLKNDVGLTIDFFMEYFFKTNEGIGLFAVPRLIFPEIDNIASYYKGNIYNNSENSILFLKKYFGRVNPEYKKKGAFIYQIYRHGLMHQHVPKFLSYRRKNIGWWISMNTPSSHLKMRGKTVKLDAKAFYNDFLKAIDLYIADLKKRKDLQRNFILAHRQIVTPISKTDFLKKPCLKQSDFNFLKGENE